MSETQADETAPEPAVDTELPATLVTIEDVVTQARRAMEAVQDFMIQRARRFDLNTTDFVALIRIAAPDQTTGGQLARAMGLRSSSMTALADRLEQAGLIRRVPHPTDRRSAVLEATPRGHALAMRAIGPVAFDVATATQAFEHDQLAAIHDFLTGLSEVFEHRARRVGAAPAPDAQS